MDILTRETESGKTVSVSGFTAGFRTRQTCNTDHLLRFRYGRAARRERKTEAETEAPQNLRQPVDEFGEQHTGEETPHGCWQNIENCCVELTHVASLPGQRTHLPFTCVFGSAQSAIAVSVATVGSKQVAN